MRTKGGARPQADQALVASDQAASRLARPDPSRCETQFLMGLRVGLGAALAVTDTWDDYTRNRIKALLASAHG